jgi:hypothetical protein
MEPIADQDSGDVDALAELFHEIGVSPQRAERYARWVVAASAPEFGEEE